MDIEQARFNMVEQQIRTWEVLDTQILDLLFVVKREDFVPDSHRALAFVDMEIPLGHGERMWTPKLEARVIQELAIRSTDRVLEIGTGSGYLTALLAARAASVVSVERVQAFVTQARARLAAHAIDNVELRQGDGARDWVDAAGFDVIVLTGSTPILSDCFQRRLRVGGRLFVITGSAPVMQAQLILCTAPGAYKALTLFETVVAPLMNAPQPEAFVF